MRATRACTCAGVQAGGEAEAEAEADGSKEDEASPAGREAAGLAREWEGSGGVATMAAEREADDAVGGRVEREEDGTLCEEGEEGWAERKRWMAEQSES